MKIQFARWKLFLISKNKMWLVWFVFSSIEGVQWHFHLKILILENGQVEILVSFFPKILFQLQTFHSPNFGQHYSYFCVKIFIKPWLTQLHNIGRYNDAGTLMPSHFKPPKQIFIEWWLFDFFFHRFTFTNCHKSIKTCSCHVQAALALTSKPIFLFPRPFPANFPFLQPFFRTLKCLIATVHDLPDARSRGAGTADGMSVLSIHHTSWTGTYVVYDDFRSQHNKSV